MHVMSNVHTPYVYVCMYVYIQMCMCVCQWLLSPVIEKCLLSMRNSWFLICLALCIVGTTAANYHTVTSLHTYLHTYNTAVHWKSVNFFLIFLNSWSVCRIGTDDCTCNVYCMRYFVCFFFIILIILFSFLYFLLLLLRCMRQQQAAVAASLWA